MQLRLPGPTVAADYSVAAEPRPQYSSLCSEPRDELAADARQGSARRRLERPSGLQTAQLAPHCSATAPPAAVRVILNVCFDALSRIAASSISRNGKQILTSVHPAHLPHAPQRAALFLRPLFSACFFSLLLFARGRRVCYMCAFSTVLRAAAAELDVYCWRLKSSKCREPISADFSPSPSALAAY